MDEIRAAAAEKWGRALADPAGRDARTAFVRVASEAIDRAGRVLYLTGSVMGDDSARAVSLVTRQGGALGRGCADLLDAGNAYAAAALLRQVVEVEYLLWTFADDPEDAARWLHASKSKLDNRFRASEMRKRSGGHFRTSEYVAHCDHGGHPSPRGWALVADGPPVDPVESQRLDLANHLDRAWRLLVKACDAVGSPHATADRVDDVRAAADLWRMVDADALDMPQPPSSEGANGAT